MHVFGLSGGIASGKSTVGKRFRNRGVPVIDADLLARDVVVPGSDGLAAVVQAFGRDVLSPDGTLDRAALGSLVFADPEKRRILERITHPRIAAEGQRRMMELAGQGHRLACYEAALLVEAGTADLFRPLVVVAASENVQIARTLSRDGCDEDSARARVRAQKPLAEKISIANHVIWNDSTREALEALADRTLDAITDALALERYPAATESVS